MTSEQFKGGILGWVLPEYLEAFLLGTGPCGDSPFWSAISGTLWHFFHAMVFFSTRKMALGGLDDVI